MYASVQEFVRALESAGELARVKGEVSPVLEISALADAMSKVPAPHAPSERTRRTDPRHHHLGGHAMLFERVAGCEMPVLINAYGSYRRMEMALGCNDAGPGVDAWHTPGGFEAVAARIAELVKPQPPSSLREAMEMAGRFLPLLRVPPRRRKGEGPCQEVVQTGEQVDLRRLPLLRCWPHDGDFAALGYPADVNAGIAGLGSGDDWERLHRGRYITLGGIHTIHADDRENHKPPSHNIGMYRVQLLGRRTLAMHWHVHHDGARHWRSWKALGRPMPVAIALGGESVLPYAATAPLPPGISELLLAGFFHGRGIEMVRARTVPLWVPANAEIVIEGFVRDDAGPIGWDPRDPKAGPVGPGAVFEGPFGDHTGFYSLPDRYPLLEVTAVTHRRDAIFPATVVGLPPQEDYFLGKATERIFLPLLRTLMPDIEDYDLPMFGAFHNAAFLQIKKEYPLQARRVMHGVWGAGQMSWTKTLAVVDADVDVHDTAAVMRAIGENCVPARDTETVRGPLDILDHASPFVGAGSKLGLDATRKWPGAETHRHLEGAAVEACSAGELPAVLGEDARATEARLRTVPGILDAHVPEDFGGWWLLIRAAKNNPGDGARVIKALGGLTEELKLPRWIVVVGPDVDLADSGHVLFHWLANSSPIRDGITSLCGRRMAFDATPKVPGDDGRGEPVRSWPPVLRMPSTIRGGLASRWKALGLPGESPKP